MCGNAFYRPPQDISEYDHFPVLRRQSGDYDPQCVELLLPGDLFLRAGIRCDEQGVFQVPSAYGPPAGALLRCTSRLSPCRAGRDGPATRPGSHLRRTGLRPTARYSTMSGEKILVIDDSTQITEFLTDVLESLGYTPLTASTGKDGIAAALAERPR